MTENRQVLNTVQASQEALPHCAEDSLERERNKLKKILDTMEIGVYIVGRNGEMEYVNPVIEREFGPPGGRKCYEYLHDMDEPCDWCKNPEVFSGKSIRWEWSSPKTGRIYESYDTPIINGDGSCSKLKVLHDITHLKQAEKALRDSEKKYRSLVEQLPAVIYLAGLDKADDRLYLSPQAKGILDITEDEYSDFPDSWLQRLHPNDRDRVLAELNRVRRTGDPFNAEYRVVTRQGEEIWIHDKARVIRDEEVKKPLFLHGIMCDITEKKRDAEKIEAYQEQLRSLASELSLSEERERRRIAYDLHDTLAQTLALSKIELSNAMEMGGAGEVRQRLERVKDLVDESIRFTRSLTFELISPTLYELGLEAALEELADEAMERHGIRVRVEDDGHDKPLSRDGIVLLFKSVRELLFNAIKHANARGVEIGIHREDDHIRIGVRDDGEGFDASSLWRNVQENRSQGLFSIRERVSHFGGEFEIQSKPGKGTEALVRFPIEASQGKEEEP